MQVGSPARGIRRLGLLLVAVAASAVAAPAPAGPGVEIKVSKHGFEPAEFKAKKGEAVRIVLSATDGEHCFAIDAFRVEKRIVPGKPTRLELLPDRAGVFPFYCCLEEGAAATTERGRITVEE